MSGTLPLMALVVIAYNIVVFLTGATMETGVAPIPLVSGAVWTVTVGDILIASGLIVLFLEIIAATRTGSATIVMVEGDGFLPRPEATDPTDPADPDTEAQPEAAPATPVGGTPTYTG